MGKILKGDRGRFCVSLSLQPSASWFNRPMIFGIASC